MDKLTIYSGFRLLNKISELRFGAYSGSHSDLNIGDSLSQPLYFVFSYLLYDRSELRRLCRDKHLYSCNRVPAASIIRSNLLNCLAERRSAMEPIVACRIVSSNFPMICSWSFRGNILILSWSTNWSNPEDMIAILVSTGIEHDLHAIPDGLLSTRSSPKRAHDPGVLANLRQQRNMIT